MPAYTTAFVPEICWTQGQSVMVRWSQPEGPSSVYVSNYLSNAYHVTCRVLKQSTLNTNIGNHHVILF